MICLVFVAISFVDKQQSETAYKEMVIFIEDRYDNFFVDEEDVKDMITQDGQKVFEGKFISELNLKQLEQRVKEESFIKDADVYRDLKGNILVRATQRRPIARLISENSEDRYIATDGTILPMSQKFTAKVILIRGIENLSPGENVLEMEKYDGLMDLLQFIYADDFWRAQVSEIDRLSKGDLVMYTQVSKQFIEFGKPENIESKFERLKIFYKDILPRKGWNTYERVNVKFNNQIICE